MSDPIFSMLNGKFDPDNICPSACSDPFIHKWELYYAGCPFGNCERTEENWNLCVANNGSTWCCECEIP